ncbi:hypothetical protein TIFTF001_007903 [Ficus carica]|uniref:Origin of replication complex subunit 4 n=1 Tax=Ficus carica TaxID=3494 RepID=A0AA87ZS32_FICCA|nr:hypothetical protein TIFTF001_007903 [Ficus carica]
MGRENPAEKALNLLRRRLCDPSFIFKPFSDSPDSNYSKLKFTISSSITEACNNSILLLGPRGSGKIAVLELVIRDLLLEFPEMISVIKLSGLLHSDDNCAFKEIARQLCGEHQLIFSKMASFDDNSQFMIAMLRECGLAHKTIIFMLDEFDLFAQITANYFDCKSHKARALNLDEVKVDLHTASRIGTEYGLQAECMYTSFERLLTLRTNKSLLLHSIFNSLQGKQRLLYSLLDAMQSVASQAVVIGDADQLLEKRVRSRFSHRKLLFLPPTKEDVQRLLEHILLLPTDSTLPQDYAVEFNAKFRNILADERFKEVIKTYMNTDSAVNYLLKFLFRAVSNMDLVTGFLSLENFKTALSNIQRQPKLECIKDSSILELYILVCMKRLEIKEQSSYNFNSIMKEYKSIHDSFRTSDYYAQNVCLRAFEHLLQRELISFTDSRGNNQSIEFRPVKLLVSSHELHQGLKSYRSCPNGTLDRISYPPVGFETNQKSLLRMYI